MPQVAAADLQCEHGKVTKYVGLEQQLSLALYNRDVRRDADIWGDQARIVAAGIEKSGIVALLGEGVAANTQGLTSVTEAVMRSAVITNEGLSNIARAVGAQTQVLTDIAQLLRSPLGTQARELYQRGARALNAGWTEEAVTELTASVETDPYDPVAQFALGIALGSAGQNATAGATMGLVVRYSSDSPKFESLAAAAAILGANAYLEARHPEEAARLVEEARGRVKDCAELELMAGRLGVDPVATARAIELAPELALDAVSLGLPGAREAAKRAVESAPVDAMYRAHAACAAIGRPPATRLPDRANHPRVVMAYGRWVQFGVPEMRTLTARIRQDLSAAQEEEASVRQIVETTPATATNPRRTANLIVIWLLTAVIVAIVAAAGANGSPVTMGGALAVLFVLWLIYWMTGARQPIERQNWAAAFTRGRSARRALPGLTATVVGLRGQLSGVKALEAALATARPTRTRPLTAVPTR